MLENLGPYALVAFLTWAACVALPDLVVIPAGFVRKYGPKLWEKIRRRSPKE